MDGESIEGELDTGTVAAVLAAHGFGTDQPAAGAVLLAMVDPPRVLWANGEAERLFGTTDLAAMAEQAFAGRGREGLLGAAARLIPGAGPGTERLRLFKGFRARTLTVSISRMTLPDGDEVLALAVPSAARLEIAPRSVESAATPPAPEAARPAPAPATARGPRRILWRTDAEHRLVGPFDPGPDLAALGALGREPLPGALKAIGVDVDGAVGVAMAARATFSGLRVLWPLTGGRGHVPVTLGGTPLHHDGGAFAGFGGFGLVDPSKAVLVPEPPAPAASVTTAAAPADQAPSAPAEAPPPPESAPAADTLGAMPRGDAPAVVVRAAFSSAKIVALRPYMTQPAAAAPPAPPARRRDDAAASSGQEAEPAEPSPAFATPPPSGAEDDARTPGAAEEVAAASPAIGAEDAAAVLAALPVATIVDCRGRVVFANAAFLALTGYASAAALDAAGGRGHLLGGLDAAEVAGVDRDRAFPIAHATGGVVPVEGRVAVITWGGVAAELMTLRPGTDRSAELQSLRLDVKRRETEAADHRALLDRVGDAAVIVDGQGRLLTVNAGAERLFGRDRTSVVGESIGAMLTPECQSAALGAVFAAGAAGPDAPAARIAVSARRRETGSSAPLTMTLRAFGPGKVGIVLRDDSELEALRDDLHQLRAEVSQTGRIRSDFLAKVSHEIRTPLNVIIGFAEIIQGERFGPLGNPRYMDYVADIHAAGKHVVDLVEDLLDLSSMQAGRHEVALKAVDANRIVAESVAAVEADAHRGRVIMRLSLAPQLPQAFVDEASLRQIMANILSNAVRFNEPGGQVIVSTAVTEAGAPAVRVRDTGVGMTETELAVAMEPFREISTGKPGGGSGLGLPLTRALVEANQATLSIKSRKREGTLVEIVLQPAATGSLRVPAA